MGGEKNERRSVVRCQQLRARGYSAGTSHQPATRPGAAGVLPLLEAEAGVERDFARRVDRGRRAKERRTEVPGVSGPHDPVQRVLGRDGELDLVAGVVSVVVVVVAAEVAASREVATTTAALESTTAAAALETTTLLVVRAPESAAATTALISR